MKLSDFDFDLPEELIALRPAIPRTASRLLVYDAGEIRDRQFSDLPGLLREGDILVVNNTRVLPVRLQGVRKRSTGAANIEITLLEERNRRWVAFARPAKRLRPGDRIEFAEKFAAEIVAGPDGGRIEVDFGLSPERFMETLDRIGTMPLPPYIASRRPSDLQDHSDYQSVFASVPGAIAAPTASLHFDKAIFEALALRGIDHVELTLHVGAGTFLPVTSEDIASHKMHAEWGTISADVADKLRAAKARGGRVVPVGTTALRLLETAAQSGTIAAWEGKTDIFIRPGHRFRAADGLITNFHLPKSTLLMLVAALIGMTSMRKTYAHAIDARYRFYSYGDACLLLPG